MIEKLQWIKKQNERSSATDDEKALLSKWIQEVIDEAKSAEQFQVELQEENSEVPLIEYFEDLATPKEDK
jgi:hypothetical protein